MSNPQVLLSQCLRIIEQQLQWGPAGGWKQRDYEQLSDLIFEKTGTRLSLSTLKRVWSGTFSSAPQPATLNALAIFIGYDSWNHFRASAVQQPVTAPDKPTSKQSWRRKNIAIVSVITFLVIAAGVLLFSGKSTMKKIPLSHKILTEGMPNTVVFSFDIQHVSARRFYFQQTWNDRTRVQIPSNSKNYTSIYYYPGYHTAKLFAGNHVIAEQKVHITTKGWEGLAFAESTLTIPLYLADSIQDGMMYFPVQKIENLKAGITKSDYWVRFYNISEFDSFSADDMEIVAKLKNDPEHGGLTCQDARFYIWGEHKMMIIPFCNPGCVANIDLSVSDNFIPGRNNDLSPLGIDLSQWQTIHLVTGQNHLNIKTNSTTYQTSYTKPLGKLKGIMIEFKGSGALDSVVLKNTANNKEFCWDF